MTLSKSSEKNILGSEVPMISTAILEKPFLIVVNIQTECCIFPIRRYVDGIEILDEQIVYQNGPYMRVKRWLRGVHPKLGTITYGLTGWETLVEKDIIKPNRTFYVYENEHDANQALLRGTDSERSEPFGSQTEHGAHGMDRVAIQDNQGSPPALLQAG